MLNGLIKPDRGTITMRGRVGALIALGAGFNPILTGRENIYINGSVLGLTKKEIDEKIDEIIDFAEIREFIDMPVQSYSSGMTVRLGFAVATALDPDVLIVDEVLAVGDFQFRWKCLDRIKKLKQSGVSILLVSHNAADLVRTCDIGILMGKGCAQFVGEINACLREYELTAPKSLQPQRGQANGGATIERTQLSLVGDDSSQGLLVRMEIFAGSRIEKCRIIVGISHSLGGNLFNVSSCWNGEWMMLEQGRNFVELKLTGFALQTGTCSLEVSLRGEELKDIYDLGRSQLHISETSPDYEGYGINGALRPECHWRVGRLEDIAGVAA
jgi:lipopolysaccharide transport system ATP-binding protein